MNRDNVFSYLLSLFDGFLYYDRFIYELVDLVAVSGAEGKFFTKLMQKLSLLRSLGIRAIEEKEFEPISGGLFSMHIPVPGHNIRVLYGFLADGTPVLLLAFHERAGKRKTDYSGYIAPALSRLNEMRCINDEQPRTDV